MNPNVILPSQVTSCEEAMSPTQIEVRKQEQIPVFVYEAFNELIAKSYDGTRARVKQNDAMKAVISRMKEMPKYNNLFPPDEARGLDDNQSENPLARAFVFGENWLDIEPAYRAAGWLVVYDKPAYNESYGAFWNFSKIPRRRSTDR